MQPLSMEKREERRSPKKKKKKKTKKKNFPEIISNDKGE